MNTAVDFGRATRRFPIIVRAAFAFALLPVALHYASARMASGRSILSGHSASAKRELATQVFAAPRSTTRTGGPARAGLTYLQLLNGSDTTSPNRARLFA